MPKINAFKLVVHEKKIFKQSKFLLFCPLNGPLRGQSIDLNKSEESLFPRDTSYHIWLKSD